MDLNILLSPPVAFFIAMGLAYAIYGFGKVLGPAPTSTPGKLEPYACGENFEAGKFSFGYRRFFIAALFFTVMHVAVLSVATVGAGMALRAIGYLVVIAACVLILFSDVD